MSMGSILLPFKSLRHRLDISSLEKTPDSFWVITASFSNLSDTGLNMANILAYLITKMTPTELAEQDVEGQSITETKGQGLSV